MKIEKFGISYDTETGEFTRDGRSVTIPDGAGYLCLVIDKKTLKAHRAAYWFVTDRHPTLHIDHINGNRCDNRWGNLREITQAQNNRCRSAYGASGFKGVYKDKNGFKAMITVNKRIIYLGRFKNKEDAAKAYDVAAIKYFGAISKLNFAV